MKIHRRSRRIEKKIPLQLSIIQITSRGLQSTILMSNDSIGNDDCFFIENTNITNKVGNMKFMEN
jgi:hypothetical protein